MEWRRRAGAAARRLLEGARTGDASAESRRRLRHRPGPLRRRRCPKPAGIAWRKAATDAEVDAAFGEARAQSKPVFLYWGAEWCPPCNQVKATLFNRQDFIERSRAFVPVYIDGDRPGAQKIGARFRVSGYPTMVLFRADGTELTRLPGEVEPARYLEVVTLGINAQRPVKDVLADARAGTGTLAPSDWRLLAFYSWETDDQQLVARREVPALLKQLAAACPPTETAAATRLWLKALAAADDSARARADPAAAGRLLQVLGDDAAARAALRRADEQRRRHRPRRQCRRDAGAGRAARCLRPDADPLPGRPDAVARRSPRRPDRPRRPGAGRRGEADGRGRVGREARAAAAGAGLLADVRDQAARADREITDGYERQAVITTAAYLLAHADLPAEADALLKGNLAKSHSPYYLMTGLAENAARARRRDDGAALAPRGLREERRPGDAAAVGRPLRRRAGQVRAAGRGRDRPVAGQLLDEAAAQPNVFYERSARSLRRVSTQLRDWNRDGAHAAALTPVRRATARRSARGSTPPTASARPATRC